MPSGRGRNRAERPGSTQIWDNGPNRLVKATAGFRWLCGRRTGRSGNHAIIFDPACHPELAGLDFLHPHRPRVTSPVDHLLTALGAGGRHHDIALYRLAGYERLIQQAVEAIATDVPGFGAEVVSGSVARQVDRPMERWALRTRRRATSRRRGRSWSRRSSSNRISKAQTKRGELLRSLGLAPHSGA